MADPSNVGFVVAFHSGFTVCAAIKDRYPLFLLLWDLFAQLRHYCFYRRTQLLFLRTIAVEWSQKDGNIPVMSGCQSEHLLFEILAVIPRIPIRDRYWHRVFLWHVCIVSTH